MRSFLCIVLCAFYPFIFTYCQNSKPTISKQPAWVTANTIDYKATSLEKEAEDGYVDLDYEKQVNLSDQSVYVKRSTKILSGAGVQDNSQVSVNFDPTYQQLIFHSIELIRDGVSINKLDLKKIKTIHEEKELDEFIYNGDMESILILEDVRKGDIIQFSYTLKGFNPIFQNRLQQTFYTRLDFPIYNQYFKIIVPPNRKINIRNFNESLAATVNNEKNNTVYEWHSTNIHALHVQDNLPEWYDPYSSIMISEFNSWSEVNNWARLLFPQNITLSAALKDKINKINSSYKTSEEKTTATLRFVQDDIRYMGIEMGVHSHKPASPVKVFDQRFGDCKEKSYLLCIMLQSMGINACPVLINTEYKKTITQWPPAATDFDHCTVRVIINNKVYWLDPTISYQRGSISNISYPDYQYGLVITDTTTALSPIKPQDRGQEDIKEIFTVPEDQGFCYLRVITTYTGSYADGVRSDFNYNSNYEMQKDYLNFYQGYFDNIQADSLTYVDNDSTGIFTTTEYYSIDSFWTSKGKVRKANFSCYVISDFLKKPKETHRTMPFGLAFPEHYCEEVDVNLPGNDWHLKETKADIHCSSFTMSRKSTVYNNRIVINYDYKRLKDNVTPEETPAYLTALQKINDAQDYEITWGDDSDTSTSSSGNSTGVVLIILISIGFVIRWSQKR